MDTNTTTGNCAQEPIVLSTPSISEGKMRAIEATANAVYEVAKALNSVNVQNTVSHCTFNGADGPAVNITGEE